MAALFLLPTRQFAILLAGIVALGAFEWASLAKVARAGRYGYSAFATALFGAIVWGFQAIDPSRREVALIYAVPTAFWMLVVPIWLARGWGMPSKSVALMVGILVVVHVARSRRDEVARLAALPLGEQSDLIDRRTIGVLGMRVRRHLMPLRVVVDDQHPRARRHHQLTGAHHARSRNGEPVRVVRCGRGRGARAAAAGHRADGRRRD